MASGTPVCLPKLGESITTATVVRWLKKEGEFVKEDEPLLEVATDKVSSEIPSPRDGCVTKLLAAVDEELDVGATLCYLDGEPEETACEKPLETKKEESRVPVLKQVHKSQRFFTPLVKKIARAKGLQIDQLEAIRGSGAKGRVTKMDLYAFLEKQEGVPTSLIPMCRVRQAISDNLQKSVQTIPQAALIQEIDLTNAMDIVAARKAAGEKISATHLVLAILAKVLPKYPLLFATYGVKGIQLHEEVHLGLAVNVDDNVQVPVIRSLQQLGFQQMLETVQDLVKRARSQQLRRDEVLGGRITLTNFGMAGVKQGIPIIRYPEAAILGMGSIDKRLVVQEDDSFAIRKMMDLTLVFDHRILDGIYACRFLQEFARELKNVRSTSL